MGNPQAAPARRSTARAPAITPYFYRIAPTVFGAVRIVWRTVADAALVSRILLPADPVPGDESTRRARRLSCARIDALASGIRAFCSGEDIVFDIEMIDLAACAPFQRLVLLAEHGIPRGMVSTYGRIARHIGHPGAARAVGTALASNPFPLVVPCHRAVREGGYLGGFRGGTAMKRALLELEGVRFRENGRVVMDRLQYESPRRITAYPPQGKRKGGR